MNRRPADEDVFQAIAHPVRRAILDRLSAGNAPVMELTRLAPISAPALSQHLKVLRDVNLVTEQRAGRMRVYQLNPEALGEVRDWLSRYEVFWTEKLDRLGEYLRNSHAIKNPD